VLALNNLKNGKTMFIYVVEKYVDISFNRLFSDKNLKLKNLFFFVISGSSIVVNFRTREISRNKYKLF
jgi:hypothetical protein